MREDYEPSSVCRTAIHKARVEHKCGECRKAIEPGESYERTEGCWNGEWATHKTCARCVCYREKYGTDQDGSYGFGALEEALLNGHSLAIWEEWKAGE